MFFLDTNKLAKPGLTLPGLTHPDCKGKGPRFFKSKGPSLGCYATELDGILPFVCRKYTITIIGNASAEPSKGVLGIGSNTECEDYIMFSDGPYAHSIKEVKYYLTSSNIIFIVIFYDSVLCVMNFINLNLIYI